MKKKSVDELVAAEELRRSAPFLLRNDRLNVLCDVSVVEKDSKRHNKWFRQYQWLSWPNFQHTHILEIVQKSFILVKLSLLP
jgi:hypothetical protein